MKIFVNENFGTVNKITPKGVWTKQLGAKKSHLAFSFVPSKEGRKATCPTATKLLITQEKLEISWAEDGGASIVFEARY